jgi:hypothetical protein
LLRARVPKGARYLEKCGDGRPNLCTPPLPPPKWPWAGHNVGMIIVPILVCVNASLGTSRNCVEGCNAKQASPWLRNRTPNAAAWPNLAPISGSPAIPHPVARLPAWPCFWTRIPPFVSAQADPFPPLPLANAAPWPRCILYYLFESWTSCSEPVSSPSVVAWP